VKWKHPDSCRYEEPEMPLFVRTGPSGQCDSDACWKGEDLLVVLDGEMEQPFAKVIREKLKIGDLQEQYGKHATVC
jgi:hypothetical protein